MGSVYRGRDPRVDRPVAIEILHSLLSRIPGIVARFRSNAIIQAKLIANVANIGIAKTMASEMLRTATGSTMGTLAYRSPEQPSSPKNVDAKPDIYSLGGLLYEMLTGRPPFVADTEFELMQRIVGEDPMAPSQVAADVPPLADEVVLRALAKVPEDRYVDCNAFRNRVKQLSVDPERSHYNDISGPRVKKLVHWRGGKRIDEGYGLE